MSDETVPRPLRPSSQDGPSFDAAPLTLSTSERGFRRIELIDYSGANVSLQESSIATEPCVWFGVGRDRAHLTQPQVRALLPYLATFVDRGKLG